MSRYVDCVSTRFFVEEVPDEVLYVILSYVSSPMDRARVLCHQLALISKEMRDFFLFNKEEEKEVAAQNQEDTNNEDTPLGGNRSSSNTNIWSLIEREYEVPSFSSPGLNVNSIAQKQKKRRISRRLQKTPFESVRERHIRVVERTETAHYFLCEMVHSKCSKKSLSLKRLRDLISFYGPNLRFNHRATIGGTLLIEVVRARYVKESAILSCIKELVERHGALVDLSVLPPISMPTSKKKSDSDKTSNAGLTALCIASARGMPSVVRYLLGRGASKKARGNGMFRLFTNPKKSLKGINYRPLDFALKMKEAEIENGAQPSELYCLNLCIKLLSKEK